MARTTLRRWLHFLILRERRRRRRHDDDANNNNINIAKEKKEAELEYIQSAVSVALLLVQSLLLNSSSSVAQQVDLDDFTVVIDCDDDALIITDEEAIENGNNNNNLQRIIESVTLVEFTPAEHKFSAAQPSGPTQQQNYRQLGIILHEIFCRGATIMPPTCNLDDEEDDDHDDDDDDSETKHSIQAAQKMLRMTSICTLDAHLLNCAVPITLCRLVIDLLIWSDEMKKETKFHSIEEVAEELMQIISRPNLFLYQSDAGDSNNRQLNFGSTLYGRRNEVGRFLRAAALVSLDTRDTHVKQLVLIGGLPGGGKTHFVESIIRSTSIEWFYIHIKFDLLQSQPLSVVMSSFDAFFTKILTNRNEQEYVAGISASLQRSLSSSAIVSLCDLIPSLRILFPNILRRVISDEDLSVQTGRHTEDEFASTSQMSRMRVHMLLRSLINAVCSVDRPLVLFFDDLQWADDRSMELLYALLERDHLQELDDNSGTHCLFVGSYRSNETNNLRSYFDILEHSTSVDVTNIHLGGLTRADCNTMISEVLNLPTRLTSPLNDLVLQKTTGNPLYIKTFLHSLVKESILRYSLPEQRWVWDIEAVKSTSIDKTVLELLARKLLDLPENVLDALRVLSCLGTKVDETTIKLLYTSPGSQRDFITCLEYAVDEHILEKSQNGYNFLHDMLKQATYETMSEEDRGKEHLSIGMHVITNASTDTDKSNVLTLFIADQINAANAHGVTEDSLHIEFAELNLKAGKASMDMSDFQSTLSYMMAGISFLHGWKGGKNYNLSLQLFQNLILACHVNREIDLMQQYLELLFKNAASFEDKLPGFLVMIQVMLSHRKHRDAIEKVLFILKELGEPFSVNITPKDVYMDLVSTKKLLDGHTTDDVITGKRMSDATIRWTLKFFNILCTPLYIMKPHVIVSIACRTVALSLEWGVCGDSALGLQTYGWGVLTFQKDVEEALKWCHAGLELAKRLNAKQVIPRVKVCLDTISYWKEPLQAKFDCLKENHSSLMMVGEFDHLGGNALHFIRRSLVCGRNLLTSEKECAALILELHKLRQELALQPMISNHLSILKLIGSNGDSEHKLNQPFFHLLKDDEINDDESLLQNALSNQLLGPVQQCYFDRLHNAFWFGNYKEAAEYAEKYEKCLSTFRLDSLLRIGRVSPFPFPWGQDK